MPPTAVLFDFDGVLADTENVHIAAWERIFGMMGWDVPSEECARAVEVDDAEFLGGVFSTRRVLDGDVAGWVRRKQEITAQILADSPRLYRGVADVVTGLKAQARLAVVSTTWKQNIETILDRSGLRDAFEVIVAKEDVPAPKPNPAAYQLALSRLDLRPDQAVALEDSPTGLAAAQAAKIRVVAVGHRRTEGDWTGGAAYLPHFGDRAAVRRALELPD